MSPHTIEIDDEAKYRLETVRLEGESLSDVICRFVQFTQQNPPLPRPGEPATPPTITPNYRSLVLPSEWRDLLAELSADPLSDSAIAAVEQVIADRELPINKRDAWAEVREEEDAERRAEQAGAKVGV